MKIHNKREIQQIAFNHSSDNYLKDFINLHKNVLGIDTTLASENALHFRENLSEKI